MRTTGQLNKIFGPGTSERLARSRVLVVGAGGIGCELLKDLSMSGFRYIEVVDLDTIDLSNLNRQFLFRRKHIKKSKSEVACKAIAEFNNGMTAVAHISNIKEPEFDVDKFASFDIVLNALDNLDARRHVNSMCLAANIPLVESGTAGYLGQTTVIKGGATECFDCHPKPVEQKTYPVCTIRSTPSAPIHCVVWAKDYLFAQLFGRPSDGGDADAAEGLYDDDDNAEELRQLREESLALQRLAEAIGTDEFPKLVFEKVFVKDINRLLDMEDMWRARTPPTPLSFAELSRDSAGSDFDCEARDDQPVLPIEQSFALFKHSAASLARRAKRNSSAPRPLSFDKDDKDMLDFVAATSNLRSRAFGIPEKSIFAIKAMAGNIIPAIATTNAIVAGSMATQAILVIMGQMHKCHTLYLSYSSRRSKYFIKDSLAKPNPRCPVCRRKYLTLRISRPDTTTLGDLVEHIAQLEADGAERGLGLGDDVAIVEGSRILYDPDFEDNLAKTFSELGLVPSKAISLASEDGSDGSVPVTLNVAGPKPGSGPDAPSISIEGFENIPDFEPIAPSDNTDSEAHAEERAPEPAGASADGSSEGAIILDDGDDESVGIESPSGQGAGPGKRKLENGASPIADGEPSSKRFATMKVADTLAGQTGPNGSGADDGLIVLD